MSDCTLAQCVPAYILAIISIIWNVWHELRFRSSTATSSNLVNPTAPPQMQIS